MCLIQDFESLGPRRKGGMIDAAFADQQCLWDNACNKLFNDAPYQDRAVLRKHIMEHYYEDA